MRILARTHSHTHTSVVFHWPGLFFQASLPTTRGPLHSALTFVCVCVSMYVCVCEACGVYSASFFSLPFLKSSFYRPFILWILPPAPLTPSHFMPQLLHCPPVGTSWKTQTVTRWHKWRCGGWSCPAAVQHLQDNQSQNASCLFRSQILTLSDEQRNLHFPTKNKKSAKNILSC